MASTMIGPGTPASEMFPGGRGAVDKCRYFQICPMAGGRPEINRSSDT